MLMEIGILSVVERDPGALRQLRGRLDRRGHRRPGHQQAAGPQPQGHRVQARPPLRHQSGRRRRDGAVAVASTPAVPAACSGRVAQAFSPFVGLRRRLRRRAADRLGHPAAATTWRAPPEPLPAARAAHLHRLRKRLRAARHGASARSTRARSARCAARSKRAATTPARRRSRSSTSLAGLLRRIAPGPPDPSRLRRWSPASSACCVICAAGDRRRAGARSIYQPGRATARPRVDPREPRRWSSSACCSLAAFAAWFFVLAARKPARRRGGDRTPDRRC